MVGAESKNSIVMVHFKRFSKLVLSGLGSIVLLSAIMTIALIYTTYTTSDFLKTIWLIPYSIYWGIFTGFPLSILVLAPLYPLIAYFIKIKRFGFYTWLAWTFSLSLAIIISVVISMLYMDWEPMVLVIFLIPCGLITVAIFWHWEIKKIKNDYLAQEKSLERA